jgi:hypothetical protein
MGLSVFICVHLWLKMPFEETLGDTDGETENGWISDAVH